MGDNTPATPATPGYKTAAFWLTLVATLLGGAVASGATDSGAVAQVLGFTVAALSSVGYASIRAWKKGADGKPAYKTTEFWLSVAAVVVGGLATCGAFPADGGVMKVVGAAAGLLAALGYGARAALPPTGK